MKPDTTSDETRFAFLKPFPIHIGGKLYLWRLRILQTPWFAVWLHAIHEPDNARQDLHDHPRAFVSFVLRGSYVEYFPAIAPAPISGFFGVRHVRWFNWKRATDAHRIRSLSRRPVWTLVFCGPKTRRWGFLTPGGWIDADIYLALKRAEE